MELGKWREFTKVDWYGMAGATSFPGDVEPLLADIQVNDQDAVVVLDANDVWIAVYDQQGNDIFDGGFATPAQGARFAATLKASYTTTELEAVGWVNDRDLPQGGILQFQMEDR